MRGPARYWRSRCGIAARSEEHTSELQSLAYLVCRLLLEKKNADRLGLPARERALVALISRYHRGKGPRKKHEEFATLSPGDQALVRRLSGLIRIADGLDRGDTAAVNTVTAELAPNALTIRVAPLLSFFFNDTATTEIYTLSLHDALPISARCAVLPHVQEVLTANQLPPHHAREGRLLVLPAPTARVEDHRVLHQPPDSRLAQNL